MSQKDMTDLMQTPDPVEPALPLPNMSMSYEKVPTYPAIFYKPVSIAFVENISLKSILQELATAIGVDLQLDPGIKSPVVFQATDRPFIEVIQDICDMAGLRYSVKNHRIRIERDSPYSKTYTVQFLNLTRNSQNRISLATNIFNSGTSSSGESVDLTATPKAAASTVSSPSGSSATMNGSDSQLNVQTSNDFWAELSMNLSLLLSQETENAPSSPATPTFSIHKQGGLLTVFANEKTHKRVQTYLDTLKVVASSQVLIEAKIIEVNLKNEFRSGINWAQAEKKGALNLKAPFGTNAISAHNVGSSVTSQNLVTFGLVGSTFSSILSLLEEFGNTRTLSSPRLTVMNNQAAILKVAKNQVYFRLNYDKQNPSNLTAGSSSVSSTIQTVPIGLMMAVQPSINVETGEVILFLRPTISKFNKTVADPAVGIAYNANLSTTSDNTTVTNSNIPVVEVREIDSVMKLRDGEIGVLGGLMEVSSVDDATGIPGFSEVGSPLKDLMSSSSTSDKIVELVILLKVTIAKNGTQPAAADHRLRNDYVADPRRWD